MRSHSVLIATDAFFWLLCLFIPFFPQNSIFSPLGTFIVCRRYAGGALFTPTICLVLLTVRNL